MKDILKTIIKDFHKRGIPEFKQRDIDVPLNSKKIISIIGPRRAGKTYLMYQTMSHISDITNIVFINFEDERLEFESKDMSIILEAYFELYPDKKESDIYFFFDEIQEITGWEKFVRRIYDTVSMNIFITGSSAKLLSKEIATSLRGRTISYEVYPLSFREFLRFRGIEEDLSSTKGKSKTISTFVEYSRVGGFPEVINMPIEILEKTIMTYFDVMLYRDVIERYQIANPLPLKIFIKRLLASSSKVFTIHKIFNDLKSEGLNISKDSLYKFLDYCKDAYIVIPIDNFSESMTKQRIRKVYAVDHSLGMMLSFALSKDLGRVLENIILLELLRRTGQVFYHNEKMECDFIIKEKEKIISAIQVCHSLTESNEDREINGLKEAMRRFNLRHGIVITFDKEETRGNISIIPAYKWLLQK